MMTMITMVMMMMPMMVAMMMSILWMMTPTSSNNAQVKNSKDGEDDFYTKHCYILLACSYLDCEYFQDH